MPGQTIRDWLAEGLQDDLPAPADGSKIEILPGSRVLNDPGRWQQLVGAWPLSATAASAT